MIKDLRKQKRKIEIDFILTGLDFDLDDYLKSIIGDIKIICFERNIPDNLKINLTIK